MAISLNIKDNNFLLYPSPSSIIMIHRKMFSPFLSFKNALIKKTFSVKVSNTLSAHFSVKIFFKTFFHANQNYAHFWRLTQLFCLWRTAQNTRKHFRTKLFHFFRRFLSLSHPFPARFAPNRSRYVTKKSQIVLKKWAK